MDIMDLSPKGKKKLTRWIGQQTRKHNNICISRMVENAPNEHKLIQMMRYIDEWHLAHPQEASLDDSGDSQDDSDEAAPETAPKASYEVPEKYTRLKQHNFSRHVSHRLNEFITNNPEVGISKMIANAATEDDLMAAMDEIETKKVVVDPLIRIWTVRQVV